MKKGQCKHLIDKRKPMCDYSLVRNDVLNDMSLSASAKAVLIYLNSKPEDWEASVKDIMIFGNFGSKNTVHKIMKELIGANYVSMKKSNTKCFYKVSQNKDEEFLSWSNSGTPKNDLSNIGTPVSQNLVYQNMGHIIRKNNNKERKKDISNDISKENSPKQELVTVENANLPKVPNQRKKDGRKNEVASILGEVLGDETAKNVIAHRKALKKPLTERAAVLLAKRLKDAENVCGMPPGAAADYMIERGWQGFDANWVKASEWDKAKGYTNDKRQAHTEFRTRLNKAFEGRSARLAKGEVLTALSFPDFPKRDDTKSIGKD